MADKKLFLLDGMALVYRAHFAFIRNPITTSAGKNVSAVFGFTNTLLDLLENQKPTHIALALDTHGPTERDSVFPDYKANREDMPEDIADALPYVKRIAEAFSIPVLEYPGYEADDIIGTLATTAEKEGFTTYMVTPDKDFAQLVDQQTFIYKPGRKGSDVEIIGVPEVQEKWNVKSPDQVADILGLWGDAVDNIPGVPGIGEKTAKKLIGEYGTIENLLEHTGDLKGKQKENLENHAEQALLSKQLATIITDAPLKEDPEALLLGEKHTGLLKELFGELEFNALGKRIIGDDYEAGRSTMIIQQAAAGPAQGELFLQEVTKAESIQHSYQCIEGADALNKLVKKLQKSRRFCFDLETDGLDPKTCRIIGLAFSTAAHEGVYVPLPEDKADDILDILKPVLADSSVQKIGHNLKFDLSVLKWNGIEYAGPFIDTMIAHFLLDAEGRHGMDFLSEVYLNYKPIPIASLIGEKKSEQISMADVPLEQITEYAAEDADVTFQLWEKLQPLLEEQGQHKVFFELEMPLMEILVDMQYEGIRIDPGALEEISTRLAERIASIEKQIHELAGEPFNLNSPKQLGEVLFDKLKIVEKPKKTKTGQYATNEQVLTGLLNEHPIVPLILDYREAFKLKNTYVDTLPDYMHGENQRIHTTFLQTVASTGRLSSANPNLQNIPIRTEMGQEIRRAFVPRSDEFVILSADYSQVELRMMAEMSGDKGLRDAFDEGLDIHAATAAKVYGVKLDEVESEMRRKAKMVNFGIIYGISAFGLSQRLGIPRGEAGDLIKEYFKQYPGVKDFMDKTIKDCQQKGYVETLTGRRRYIKDINSSNNTIRGGAERMAINAPLQGTAADLIKLAMIKVKGILDKGGFKTRMLLQIHDELLFDLHKPEETDLLPQIEYGMKMALPLEVPIVVEMGTGKNWLEAH